MWQEWEIKQEHIRFWREQRKGRVTQTPIPTWKDNIKMDVKVIVVGQFRFSKQEHVDGCCKTDTERQILIYSRNILTDQRLSALPEL